jgi:Flp pilus assembly protein protease CpaA
MSFEFIEPLRVIVLLIGGAYLCYSDVKNKKIPNLALLIWGILGLLLLLIEGENRAYFFATCNFFLALIASFFLWKLRIWRGGDAKFFSFCTLFLPIALYTQPFLFAGILVNAFIFGFLVLLIPLLWRGKKIEAFRSVFSKKILIDGPLSIFGLFYFLSLLFSYFKVGSYGVYIFSLIFGFSIFTFLSRYSSKYITYFLLSLAVLRCFIDKSFLSLEYWSSFLSIFLILIFSAWIGILALQVFSTEKRKEEIADDDTFLIPIFASPSQAKTNLKNSPHSFEKQDISKTKQIGEVEKFVVFEKISFSPFLYFSTLFIFLFKTDLILLLASVSFR